MILSVVLAAVLLAIVMASVALSRAPLPPSSPISERADRRWRRGVLIAAIAVAVLGNIPFVGLPGAGWLALAEPMVDATTDWPLGSFRSGASWPSAMMITAIWPASFLPAYRLARLARSKAQLAGTGLAALLLVALSGVLVALAFIVLYFIW